MRTKDWPHGWGIRGKANPLCSRTKIKSKKGEEKKKEEFYEHSLIPNKRFHHVSHRFWTVIQTLKCI